ncbi:NAD(P)H-binding protein, partial [Microbacterium sp. BF1]
MSRIIVFGGHGRIALLLAPLLVARGDEVTGVIRNPDHSSDVEAGGAKALVADVESMDVEALAEIIRGHDAVVWSAGAGGGSAERTYAVDR